MKNAKGPLSSTLKGPDLKLVRFIMSETSTIFECTFQIVVIPKFTLLGVNGKLLGKKRYGSIEALTSAINKAFGKTIPVGRKLQVIVNFFSNGTTHEAILTDENYSEGLTTIGSLINEEDITLNDIL